MSKGGLGLGLQFVHPASLSTKRVCCSLTLLEEICMLVTAAES